MFYFFMDAIVYRTPPADFNPSVLVSGCFCLRDGKVLIMKRHPDKSLGGTWGIPSGKREGDETSQETAQRELFEETGLAVKLEDFKLIGELYIRRKSAAVKDGFINYTYTIFSAPISPDDVITLNMDEHTEWQWIYPEDVGEVDPLISKGHEVFEFYMEKIGKTNRKPFV